MANGSDISRAVRLAFFGKFGGRLRPFQAVAFREIDFSTDALVVAETGSGKTEAVLAPVAQRVVDMKKGGGTGLLALVVSPTRALARDLHRRMAGAFDRLGIRLDVATSDYRSIGRKSSDVLIRTPEGLENDLIKNPSRVANVGVMVIDELHKFLDNPRGTQLCGELARLSDISPGHIRLGLSATIQDPSLPARSGILRNPKIVSDPSATCQTELIYFDWLEEDREAAGRLVKELKKLGVKKVIGFAKRKVDVETYSHLLNQGYMKGKSFPHHANMSSADRKRIEEHLRTLPCAFVVSTTTLEVGIDIGDIDTCILFTPPPDQNSYLQRIGRAGRRSGKRRVILVCGRPHRRTEYASVASLTRGRQGDASPFLAGYLQQLLAFIAQNDGASSGDLTAFSTDAFKVPEHVFSSILQALSTDGFLALNQDSIEPMDGLRALIESKEIIRTFASSGGTPVIDESTGRYLGRAAVGVHKEILLAGKGRKIKSLHPQTGAAIVSSSASGVAAFSTSGLSVFEVLARKYERKTGRVFRIV